MIKEPYYKTDTSVFSLENVSFSYRRADEQSELFNRLSLAFPGNSMTGIIGPNGCGKTTLLNLLARQLIPGKGKIRFMGKDLSSYSRKTMSRQIALVSQNFYINFPYTVEEVVMMGRHPYIPRFGSPSLSDIEIVEKAMIRADILRFRGTHVTELSGGERQRVVFARALAQKTPFLFLDEATSNLDIGHTLALMKLVTGNIIKGGQTVIAVFQDINLAAMFCNNLVLMKEGKIEVYGSVPKVLTSENIRSVFNVESNVYKEPLSGNLHVSYLKEAG